MTDTDVDKGAGERGRCACAAVRVELAEMHHRVANVLQGVRALLGRHARAVCAGACADGFARADAQLHAFGLLHQRLRPVDAALETPRVCCAAYLAEVCRDLAAACLAPSGWRLDYSASASVPRSATDCRGLALLVTELVLNASKHAFRDGRAGVVAVALRADAAGTLRLTVADDGVGLPDGPVGRGEGVRLVELMARGLRARCVVSSGQGGTRYEFEVDAPQDDAP